MLHIIANPASQSGSAHKKIRELINCLKKEKMEAVLHMTTHKGHAGELIRKLQLTDQDQLLIVGGDGSLNEMINGIDVPCMTPILLYPSGSGNDFARGMKISHSLEDLISRLKTVSSNPTEATNLTRLDLGEVTSTSADPAYFPPKRQHRFAVSCGFGMDAQICHYLETGKLKSICNRLHVGKLSYLLVGLRTLLTTDKKKRASILVHADRQEMHFSNTVFVAVHNLPYEGGGFPFAPEASPVDGYLDVCIVHVPSRLFTIPLLIACLLGGRHTMFKRYVKSFRCKKIKVEADRPMALHTDGEVVLAQTSFSAQVLEGALS